MFDIGWSELLLIGAVALVVIGPKDLPKVLRTVGQATAKLRRMAGEFQAQFNEAMREAELDEIKKNVADLNQAASFNPVEAAREEIRNAIESKPAEPAASSTPATAGATAGAEAAAQVTVPAPPAVPDAAASVAAQVPSASEPESETPKAKPRRKPAPKVGAEEGETPAAEPAPARKRSRKKAEPTEGTPGEGASA